MTSKYLKIDSELTLHYVESGSGNMIIFMLPGWTMSTQVFEHQIGFFKDSKKYRFICVDPRAHGLSSKTEGGHFYEQHGRDMNTFIERLELENIVLCGWSFGTLAALSYVNQFSADRLSGFVMLDGPPRATGADNENDWVTYTYDDRDGSREFYTLGRLRNRAEANIEFASWMLEYRTAEKIDRIIQITNQTPDTAASLLNATSDFLDFRSDLISLSRLLPILYIVREDRGKVVSNWASQNTPEAGVVSFGGHMMFWERPEQFNRALLEFLDGCKPCSLSGLRQRD